MEDSLRGNSLRQPLWRFCLWKPEWGPFSWEDFISFPSEQREEGSKRNFVNVLLDYKLVFEGHRTVDQWLFYSWGAQSEKNLLFPLPFEWNLGPEKVSLLFEGCFFLKEFFLCIPQRAFDVACAIFFHRPELRLANASTT